MLKKFITSIAATTTTVDAFICHRGIDEGALQEQATVCVGDYIKTVKGKEKRDEEYMIWTHTLVYKNMCKYRWRCPFNAKVPSTRVR